MEDLSEPCLAPGQDTSKRPWQEEGEGAAIVPIISKSLRCLGGVQGWAGAAVSLPGTLPCWPALAGVPAATGTVVLVDHQCPCAHVLGVRR